MARTWFSIRVELVEGGGKTFWPRPGRTFAAGGAHTFADLADAIDTAFARWDLAHLREFRLVDGTRIGPLDEDEDEDEELLDEETTKLSRLAPSDRFLYVFDFGDRWNHLCTVEAEKVDPLDVLGGKPSRAAAVFRVGRPARPARPSLRRRRRQRRTLPHDPHRTDLPPFFPWWGEGAATHPD